MNDRLKSVGKVAGMSAVVLPSLRRLMNDMEGTSVLRQFPVSREHLRTTRTRALIAGSLIGIGVGFAAGVLLSPKLRGKMRTENIGGDMRERVSDTVHDVRQKATETVHDVREKAGDTLQDVRGKVEESMDTAQEKVQEGMQATQSKVEHGMDTLQQKAEHGMDAAEQKAEHGMQRGGQSVWSMRTANEQRESASTVPGGALAHADSPYLEGLHYPIVTRDLQAKLLNNGAPQNLIQAAERLPDRVFSRFDEISLALADAGYRESSGESGKRNAA